MACGVSRVSESEARGVHQALLVLPEVIFVDARLRSKREELASFTWCRSCDVCKNCFDDTFVRSLDRGLPPFCKCLTAKCDQCQKPLTRQHFRNSRWQHRHEEGRTMVCLRCAAANKLQPCVVCARCGNRHNTTQTACGNTGSSGQLFATSVRQQKTCILA